ncbi:MAG: hypothetical protein AAF682_15650 [Planctomycetota bacterium]
MSTTTATPPAAQSPGQRLFLRGLIGALLDLLVLGVVAEHWERVAIESFTATALVALALQAFLKLTLAVERRVERALADAPKSGRVFATWMLLVASKLLMLEAIDFAFGDEVAFLGPLGGAGAFVVVVLAMVLFEALVLRLYRRLG